MSRFKKAMLGILVVFLVATPVIPQRIGIPALNITEAAIACPNGNPNTPDNLSDPQNAGFAKGAPQGAQYVCQDTTGGYTYLDGSGNPIQSLDSGGNAITPCSSNGWNFNDCIVTPALTWVGSGFLSIGVAALELAGLVFDTLIYYTIVNFNTTLTTAGALGSAGAIAVGWTLFRDIANIMIIGMFVFIAINIILGNKTYGEKTLIARVLIVAILINFSLLFTQLIIDGSDLTAFQFYHQMAGSTAGQYDIASAFLAPMRITSIGDTHTLVAGVADATQSGIQGFLYGLVGGMFLLGVALVLLYGCVIIGIRAVVLVILMLTSSAAFATHLIPKLSEGKYSWSGWWKSLLNAAVLAPLLMIFIFISLKIVSGTQSMIPSGSTFGNLISNPTTITSAWSLILVYMLGLGLLYASFKISSSFASSISSFDFVGSGLGRLAASSAGLTSRFVAAPIARQTIGRAAQSLSKNRGEGARSAQLEAARLNSLADAATNEAERKLRREEAAAKTREAERLFRRADQYGAVAKSGLNIMNTGAAKQLTKAAGVTGAASGQSKAKGVLAVNEERAKNAAKRAEKAAPTAEQLEEARRAARREIEANAKAETDRLDRDAKEKLAAANAGPVRQLVEQREGEVDQKKSALGNANTAIDNERQAQAAAVNDIIALARQAKAGGDNRYNDHLKEVDEAESGQQEVKTRRDAVDAQLQQRIVEATVNNDSVKAAALQKQLQESQESRVSEMRHQADRIAKAREKIVATNANAGAASNARIQQLGVQVDAALAPLDTQAKAAADDLALAETGLRTAQEERKKLQSAADQAEAFVKSNKDRIDREAKGLGDDRVAALRATEIALAGQMGRMDGNFITRSVRGLTGDAEDTGKIAEKMRAKARGSARLKEALNSALADNPPESGGGGAQH